MSQYALKILLVLSIWVAWIETSAQNQTDKIYKSNIKTVKFTKYGDPIGYPVIRLNSSDLLELHFDDMDAGVKNYYYNFQMRINNYKTSTIAITRYTHYQANIPDKNCMPTKSGNYLLKVFLDGDPNKLVFTRRMLVVDEKLPLGAQVTQPFNQQYFQTHHRIQVQIETTNMDIRYPQQQIQLKILQNFRWDNAISINQPTFIRQGMLQYNNETNMVFNAAKEYRWLNLRSFRLLGDRITRQQNTNTSNELFVKDDFPRLPR